MGNDVRCKVVYVFVCRVTRNNMPREEKLPIDTPQQQLMWLQDGASGCSMKIPDD